MGASERRKGAQAERELRRLLADELGGEVARNLDQTRDGGHDLVGVGRWAVEVKRCEQLALPAWWRQACAQADAVDLVPALAYRQSRKPWRFVVPLPAVMGQEVINPAAQPWATLEIAGFAMLAREQGVQ